jgi:hypothetical protein
MGSKLITASRHLRAAIAAIIAITKKGMQMMSTITTSTGWSQKLEKFTADQEYISIPSINAAKLLAINATTPRTHLLLGKSGSA